MDSIRTSVHRAYHLTSSFFTFQKEVDFLRNYLTFDNYFNIDECLEQFFNKVYRPTEPLVTVPREQIYIKLPYIGQSSEYPVNFFYRNFEIILASNRFQILPWK